MKYTSSLKVECNIDEQEKVLKLFIPEDKKLSNGRAEYLIKQQSDGIYFEIQADDAVALRALITSIAKTLDIYEQTTKIIEQE